MNAPRYFELPDEWQALCNAMAWQGTAVVNPADYVERARTALDFLSQQGWLLVRETDIEPRKSWRWKR